MCSGTPNRSLDHPMVLQALLRQAVGEAGVRALTTQDNRQRVELITDVCRKYAKILLGGDPTWNPTEWNQPGAIDAFVDHCLRTGEIDPERRITAALFRIMKEIFQADSDAARQRILVKYVEIFMGADVALTGDRHEPQQRTEETAASARSHPGAEPA